MAYFMERRREAEYNEAMKLVNPPLIHPLMNQSAANAAGQAIWQTGTGQHMGAVNQAWPQAPLEPRYAPNTQNFSVEKVDNGFIIRSGKYSKICKDVEELSAHFVSIMVEKQLDK